jgi:hypothetical protein
MQVEHELGQRAMQARDLALHHREARAGNLDAGLEIQPAQRGAEIDVVARRGDGARRAPAQHLDVAGFVLADRHAFVRQVGDQFEEGIEARHQFGQRRLAGFQRVAQAGDFGHHGGSVLALALQHADLLRQRVALGLQVLFRKVESLATGRQSLGDGIEVVAQKLNVEHVETSGISGGRRCGESADYTRGGFKPFLRP